MMHVKKGLFGHLMLLGVLCCGLNIPVIAASDSSDDSQRTVRYRKNIDALSAEELAAYEHAVAMMKKKSQRNIYDRTGFLWQAWVHNCTSVQVNADRQLAVDDITKVDSCHLSGLLGEQDTHREHPGMCEHAKDTFFQWHRAEFYFYEKSLQAADPMGLYGPSTKDVTVPYWNFTHPPSGTRYPEAFENPSSPLFDGHRNLKEVTAEYTTPALLANLIYNDDWLTFGGYPTDNRTGNFGSFEYQIHNRMHSEYIAGFLANTTSAGLDPLFYVFHSFIDYIFEKWIEVHGSDNITSGRIFARGEQADTLLMPVGFSEGSGAKRPSGGYTKNMGRGEIYFDTRKQGYAYQPGPGGEFMSKEELDEWLKQDGHIAGGFGSTPHSRYARLLGKSLDAQGLAHKAVFSNKVSFTPHTLPVTRAMLDIVRESGDGDYTFQTDVYLSPQGVEVDVTDEAFRARYLVISGAYWKLSGHHQHSAGEAAQSLTIKQNITDVVNNAMRAAQSEQTWSLTLVVRSEYQGEFKFLPPAITIY